jgi:hypothetical protein
VILFDTRIGMAFGDALAEGIALVTKDARIRNCNFTCKISGLAVLRLLVPRLWRSGVTLWPY